MASRFAVIETGGKQYKVAPGDKVKAEKFSGEAGDNITFDKVLLRVDGDKAEIGAPYVAQAAVQAKVLRRPARKRK